MPNKYTSLITGQHADKPRFAAFVDLLTTAAGDVSAAIAGVPDSLNLDVAVGAQLDTVGRWVGISRYQTTPIVSVVFAFDTAGLGWDQGVWNGPLDSTEGVTVLDDATYRYVLKAKIATNYWDGTNDRAADIGLTSFAGLGVYCCLIDNQDMSVDVYVTGNPSLLVKALIQRGVVPPIPAGVRVGTYYFVGLSPAFALDVAVPPLTAGLDAGAFL